MTGRSEDQRPIRRVSVVGNSGAGKSTVARRLAERLDVPHVELDGIFHQADWTPLDEATFTARVEAALADEGWVVDGNYRVVTMEGPVWARADTVLWIDPPDRVVMYQVITRTLRRTLGRKELWNGNRERFRNIFRLDPHRSIIAWAWSIRKIYRARYRSAMTDPTYDNLRFVRLRSRRDIDTFFESLDRERLDPPISRADTRP